MNIENKKPNELDRYTAANLSPELVERLILLEEDFRNATNKDVILIAYQENELN